MSKIEELIQKFCPNGVENKPLKEVCSDIIVPMRDRPKVFDGSIPWCRIEDIEGQYLNRSLSGLAVSESVIKSMNLKVYPTGTVICSCSASIGVYCINTQPLITNQTFIGLVCGENVLNRYLYYLMQTQTKKLIGLSNSGTIPYISRKRFEELTVPIPPIEVQQEIVRILDKFAVMCEKLKKELELRKKQYEYYCEYLITREKGTEKSLKDILLIKNGRDYKHLKEGNIPVYGSGGVMTYVNESTYDKSSVLIPRKGSLDKLYYVDTPFWNVDTVFYTEIKTDIIVPKYLYYSLRLQHLEKLNNAGGVPSLTQSVLKNVCVLVPPISEQERIVSILDKFEDLLHNKKKGLPAEIRKVQQQYEYYRDKLLTFKILSYEN